MQKRWMIGLIGTTALLGTVIGGSAALAQTATPDAGTPGATVTAEVKETPLQKFSSRLAQILGIEQSKVEDALKQARKELAEERLKEKLQRMVEAGKLTQAQADEYLAWHQARPEGVPGFLGLGRLMGGPRGGGTPGMHGQGPRGHGEHGDMKTMPSDHGTVAPSVTLEGTSA